MKHTRKKVDCTLMLGVALILFGELGIAPVLGIL